MSSFKIICIANSRKLSGRCIAGLRIDGKGWIRPVSESPEGTLFQEHYILKDGSEAQVLDVLESAIRYWRKTWVSSIKKLAISIRAKMGR